MSRTRCKTIKLYHGTPKRNAKAILRDGLRPPPWDNGPDALVYLADEPETACGWGKNRCRQVAVFAVELCVEDARRGPYSGMYAHRGPIPPGRLRRVR